MKAVKIAHKIRALRIAIVAWYINQSSSIKCTHANKLEDELDSLIRNYSGSSEVHDRLLQMFCKAGWMATGSRHVAAR